MVNTELSLDKSTAVVVKALPELPLAWFCSLAVIVLCCCVTAAGGQACARNSYCLLLHAVAGLSHELVLVGVTAGPVAGSLKETPTHWL